MSPVLREALRRLDGGDNFPDLEEIRQAAGLTGPDVWAAIQALKNASPPYLDVQLTSGWSEDYASGNLKAVHERARRELGSWPSADALVDRLVEALGEVADAEQEPERKGKIRAAADTLGGIARDVAVRVIFRPARQARLLVAGPSAHGRPLRSSRTRARAAASLGWNPLGVALGPAFAYGFAYSLAPTGRYRLLP